MISLEKQLHNLNLLRMFRKKKDGYNALVLNSFLFQFANGMAGLFGVVFIYQLGGSLSEGLWFVLMFFGFERLVVSLVIPAAALVVAEIGYRWVMVLAAVLTAVKFYLLSLVTSSFLWPIYPALIFGGISIPAYSLVYYSLFLDDNTDSKIGEQSGFLFMLGSLAMVISPFVAGILVFYFGFSVMFLVSVAILILSVIPLFGMKRHKRHENYSFKKAISFIKNRNIFTRSMFTWALADGVQTYLWPIYLFLVVGGYLVFGIVGSIAMVANAIAIWVVGKYYDKRAHRKLFLGSSFMVSLTWATRFLSLSSLGIIVSDVVNRIVSPPWWMKIKRNAFAKGESIDSLAFAVAHEYVVTFGYTAGLVLGFIFLIVSNGYWAWLILPTVAGTVVATWIVKDE